MGNKSKETITYTGTYIANKKGFGFVSCEGLTEDLFIPIGMTKSAFHLDIVEIALLGKRSRSTRVEAKVVRIISHGITEVVGTYEREKGFGFVIPDNGKIADDIYVTEENSMGAVTGHKVVVSITSYGSRRQKPEGRVIEILGHENDPGVDIMSVIRGYDLPVAFPQKALAQANTALHPINKEEMLGRRDLRDMLMVTIDGRDSKDLDDAVSLSFTDGIYHLGVHIADVTNYVKETSALDKEAIKRGTSVYLTDRVIPMLPHALSNGICSLNMGEERLSLSCLMDIDESGKVLGHEIVEAIINVDERMVYADVNEILFSLHNNENTDLTRRYEKELPMLMLMEKLADILNGVRKKRGSIDFDIPESKITVNKSGRVVKVAPYERGISERIIEEFMLLANETVAEHFYWLETPFVYRVHGVPDTEKILKLGTFINNFGYSIRLRGAKNEVHPKEIQKLLTRIEGTGEEALISRLALRSMQRAEYSTECSGHFGLAANYYCHFTSPIRRYPDLQIHRIIKEQIHGGLRTKRLEHYKAILPEIAKECSVLERRADDAERDVEKIKKCEYMLERVGKEYDGVISGITDWGIYVELPNTVEGMIHVSSLTGDYFYYKEDTYEMVGRSSGKAYKLGQKIRIRVSEVDVRAKIIDFEEVRNG